MSFEIDNDSRCAVQRSTTAHRTPSADLDFPGIEHRRFSRAVSYVQVTRVKDLLGSKRCFKVTRRGGWLQKYVGLVTEIHGNVSFLICRARQRKNNQSSTNLCIVKCFICTEALYEIPRGTREFYKTSSRVRLCWELEERTCSLMILPAPLPPALRHTRQSIPEHIPTLTWWTEQSATDTYPFFPKRSSLAFNTNRHISLMQASCLFPRITYCKQLPWHLLSIGTAIFYCSRAVGGWFAWNDLCRCKTRHS